MNGFIEVTEQIDGLRVLVPLHRIVEIIETDEGVFFETGIDKKGEPTGFFARESFDEIKSQMR